MPAVQSISTGAPIRRVVHRVHSLLTASANTRRGRPFMRCMFLRTRTRQCPQREKCEQSPTGAEGDMPISVGVHGRRAPAARRSRRNHARRMCHPRLPFSPWAATRSGGCKAPGSSVQAGRGPRARVQGNECGRGQQRVRAVGRGERPDWCVRGHSAVRLRQTRDGAYRCRHVRVAESRGRRAGACKLHTIQMQHGPKTACALVKLMV